MHNFSFRSSVMRRKQKFRVLGFKSDTTVLTFTFRFLSSPDSFFAFLASFLFSLAGNLVGFIFEEKVFRKAFRWVVEQDFHGNFQVNVTWFFDFFSGVLDRIVLIMVWFERSLHSA